MSDLTLEQALCSFCFLDPAGWVVHAIEIVTERSLRELAEYVDTWGLDEEEYYYPEGVAVGDVAIMRNPRMADLEDEWDDEAYDAMMAQRQYFFVSRETAEKLVSTWRRHGPEGWMDGHGEVLFCENGVLDDPPGHALRVGLIEDESDPIDPSWFADALRIKAQIDEKKAERRAQMLAEIAEG